MSNTYLLRLAEHDLGQILEGLRAREESWRKTAEYLALGYYLSDDSFTPEECSDEHEAINIAHYYARIIRDLEYQQQNQPQILRRIYLQGKADCQNNLMQRILTEWETLRQLPQPLLSVRLFELRDEICDD